MLFTLNRETCPFIIQSFLCSYSLATDHLQKTVFYHTDVVRLLYPAWSPYTGVFPFSSSEVGEGFSMSATSYASNVDSGVRAMLVSGDSGTSQQVLDVADWIGNTSTFLHIISNATAKLQRMVTAELEGNAEHATAQLSAAAIILIFILALSPIVFLLVYRMTLTIQNYALGLSKKTKELRREKKRSDTLLYQMLPKSVALQLKLSKKVC